MLTGTVIASDNIIANLTEADPRIAKDYAYFKADVLTQAQQNSYDLSRSIDDAPAVDFAWAKAMARARNRNRPTWETEKARFKDHLDAQRYASAIGTN